MEAFLFVLGLVVAVGLVYWINKKITIRREARIAEMEAVRQSRIERREKDRQARTNAAITRPSSPKPRTKPAVGPRQTTTATESSRPDTTATDLLLATIVVDALTDVPSPVLPDAKQEDFKPGGGDFGGGGASGSYEAPTPSVDTTDYSSRSTSSDWGSSSSSSYLSSSSDSSSSSSDSGSSSSSFD